MTLPSPANPLPVIHIVAPTLQDRTGHCYSHVLSLLKANENRRARLEIWAGRKARDLFPDTDACRVHRYFSRPLQRLQTLFLYRQLLRRPGRIYLPTGTRTDLLLLDWAARKPIPRAKVFMLFHWLKLSERKQRYMTKIAQKHPDIVTMGPTDGIVQLLRLCGFSRAQQVPYPITPVKHGGPQKGDAAGFRYLLFAGAARADKGFVHVVELVRFLARQKASIPVMIQCSPPHTGVHEPAVAAALKELDAIDYPYLQRSEATLDEEAYFNLFAGAVSLQLYDPQDYASDRISGVTLDALSSGSPVLVTAGTWMARVAERFGAGLAVADLSPSVIADATRQIQDEFASFQAAALHAGEVLQRENDAGYILARIVEDIAPAE
jgi:hypothetical protein